MSKQALILALTRGTWLVHENYVNTYLPLVARFLNGEKVSFFDDIEKQNAEKSMPFAIAMVSGIPTIYKSFDDAPVGSVAVINMTGPILKQDNCGAPGTATLGQRHKAADNHPNISAHIIVTDSGGGSVDGTMDFANVIKASVKPVVSFVDGMMASAAYWIGSASSEIVANNETAQIGSIGTASTMYDNRAYLEKNGYKMIYVNADTSPDKNQTYFQAIDGNTVPLREGSLNPLNAIFHNAVKENRSGKLKMSGAEPLTGKVYLSQQALEMGLIDHIGNFDFAVQRASELGQAFQSNQSINNNQIPNPTMKVKAIFASMVSFFTTKFTGFKADETVLTEEHLETLNAELGTLDTVKASLKTAETAVSTLTGEKATLQKAHDELGTTNKEMVAEIQRLCKLNPGATSVFKEKDDTTTEQSDWETEMAALPHNKAVDNNPMFKQG
ncbi:MAG: S49 family peptidase [Bacteroidota bacterium]